MGEFGATAVVAGMIPRKTMTISFSIYQNVQLGHDTAALPLLLVSLAIVFITVCAARLSQRTNAPYERAPYNVRLPLAGFPLEDRRDIRSTDHRIFGPSGAGKTSLLDLIAGLRGPLAGTVQIEEKILFDADERLNLAARFRHIG